VIGGAAFCLIAALAYSTVNVFMRQLTSLHCDPFLATFGREAVSTLLVAPWLVYRALHGRPTLPDRRTLRSLLLVGVLIQVVGNICLQWSLGVVGLAIAVPGMFATTITAGAILGWATLGERVSIRSAAAIAVLFASLGLLGMGAETVGQSIAAAEKTTIAPLAIVLAVGAAGLAGAVFSLLNIVIRHSVTRTTLPGAVAFLIPFSGAVSLAPLLVLRLGVSGLAEIPGEQLLLMAAAGFFNIIGFFAFILGLQRTTVVHANVVNASQVAMAAVAGMALFHEPPNPWLVLGVGLTVVGIVSIDRPPQAIEEIPPP
jgi:drug/metabolite transporter, DME family